MKPSKVVFITGGSRGIGLATVKKFSNNGWKVAAFYNKTEGPEIENVKWYKLEISDHRSIKDAFEKAFKDFGQIDSFVNCVGIFGYKNIEEYDEHDMDRIIAVNEKGTYLATKEIIKIMSQGTIIYIGSTAAQVGSTDPVYSGTKGAVLSFTKSMAKYLSPNIRVNSVCPGITKTEMTQHMDSTRLNQLKEMTLLKRIAEPVDIANMIYFLASDEAVHITGACFDVNAGYVMR